MWAAGGVVSLLGITAAIALGDPRPDTLIRHAYLPLVVIAGVRNGLAGGLTAATAAVLLHAPFVLPHVEREGFGRGAVEGLTTFVLLLGAGASTGALAAWGTRERSRHETLTRIQRALAADLELAEASERVRAVVAERHGGEVAVLLADDDREVIAGRVEAPRATIDAVLSGRGPRFVPDLGGGSRPRRAVAAPIVAGEHVLGVLSIVRAGEIARPERETVAGLGAYLGLALENARLAAAQRRFAEELRAKVAAATRHRDALDRARADFVAVASHELRTPLTALRGFSELLTLRAFSGDEVRRFARVMQEETERLVRIVDDLLDLSRMEQGLAPPLRRAPVAPATALAAVVTRFEHAAGAHRLEVDAPPGLPSVHGDPDAIDRILTNLVANAIKYAPGGPIKIGARAGEAVVEFSVEDRGPGIPPEALPRLFEPYFRVDDGRSAVRGTGLGLAVVRALVEAHDGVVSIESALEIGTRVRFTIPSVS